MNTPFDRTEDLPPGDELRAGEYVLGVLDTQARRQAQARIESEAAFAQLVHAWEQRFAPWLLRVQAIEPSPHVWPRIRAQLGWSPMEGAHVHPWNSVRVWRTATALAAAAAVAAIVIGLRAPPAAISPPVPVVVQPPPEETGAKPVAVLARDDGATAWIASIDAANGKLTLAPVPAPADAQGRINELWIIPKGQAPISLGLVSSEMTRTVVLPERVRAALVAGSILAVTLEPQAGIPHAAPTGPVIAKGDIVRI